MDNVAPPTIELISDYCNNYEIYKENMRLVIVEHEVTGWIMENNIAKMKADERTKLEEDLSIFNAF